MAGSTYGHIFRITTFGESHGLSLGVIVDGCPAGLDINEDFIQKELDRRRPSQSKIVSQRKEKDLVKIVSGVFEGKTLGTPICMIFENADAKSKDYQHIATSFRPSHADFTYFSKYKYRDYRGGGRSSARETIARVAAGAIAKIFLKTKGINIQAYVSQVGNLKLNKSWEELDLSITENNIVRCPDLVMANQMEQLIKNVKKEGDTIGGVVSAVISGVWAGLGEPVFDKLHAELGKAVLSINACKGFEYGSGFGGVSMKGSDHNDIFVKKDQKIQTQTNNSGGVQGGISNGMPIYFRAAFKPVATIMQDQVSINESGKSVIIKGKGRHDPCVVPRAVPIVEAMAAIVLADMILRE